MADRRRIHFLWRPFLKDPADGMVLEVAVEAKAEVIVTHNVRDFEGPESLYERAREIAKREGVSINQLIATALAEKGSALDTLEYLEARAARGSRQAFLEVLSRVPDATPMPGDEFMEKEEG